MNINQNNISLELAKRLSDVVNESWQSGEMLEKVTPVTAELLKFWFGDDFCSLRSRNFHQGQRQAILNIIYLHEIIGEKKVIDAYSTIAPDLMENVDLAQLAKDKYRFPKYCVKMATGTGKTWVMHALIIWQVLNAKRNTTAPSTTPLTAPPLQGGETQSQSELISSKHSPFRFTKNFLLVAPGLIVYDRLLDAFLGRKESLAPLPEGEGQGVGSLPRDPQTSDFVLNQEVFLPPQYRHEFFSFLQRNVVTKEDGIGKKVTGDGLIAITNWHLFENQIEVPTPDPTPTGRGENVTPQEIISDLLPVRPGKAAGNDLGMLDRRALGGSELEYLAGLNDLMVINDEAHHIHEIKRGGETEEVEWQQGLNKISETKDDRFFQVDFSATPYDTQGSGDNVTRIYFPHIIVDFDLQTAMRLGLVKLLLLDRRQELTELASLDYNAVRDDNNNVTGLSDGQRIMLRAGLTKLKKLEDEFLATDETKNPKMMIVCQDTSVSPFVEDFLKSEGLNDDDIVTIDSNKQGEVKPEEWKRIKTELFNIDHHKKPKVVISVLMLREGFDVNNICVLVPLRSSKAPILLEQLIGRGLRLMWREPEYQSIKREDRKRVLMLHKAPKTYIDTLSVIEHPAFIKFYNDLLNNGLAAIDEGDVGTSGATGDIITVPLREGFEQYDFEWPVILHDAEQEIDAKPIDINKLKPFEDYPLALLRKFLATEGETFASQEVMTKTTFGRYRVTADLFTAESYNEYLSKLLQTITMRFSSANRRGMPTIQVNEAQTVAAMDLYIRTRLFSEPFDPFNGNDWKILLAKDGIVTKHIVEEFAKAMYQAQQQLTTIGADVAHTPFSSVKVIRMRESFSIDVTKCIYARQGWPTHGGNLEKAFMLLLEQDADVERWLKINETQHAFAQIFYMRKDGLMATYHPDFLVATAEKVYLIETKGDDKVDDANVRQKQIAATEWVKKINTLPEKERMAREWEYVLIPESTFYNLEAGGASLTDICTRCRVSNATARGYLF